MVEASDLGSECWGFESLLAILSVPSIAHAQTKIEGVWATAEACRALFDIQSGKDSFPAGFDTFSYLRNGGMNGWEWGCDFMDRSSNGHDQTVVTSICGGEGDSWPALFLLQFEKQYGWKVIGVPDNNHDNVTEFPVQCRGVK